MTIEFDPNAAAGEGSGIFGLPYAEDEAALVFVPVPWEVTTSYGGGTSRGPEAILHASQQVDLYDSDILKPYEAGLFMRSQSSEVLQWNEAGKQLASSIIEVGGSVEGNPKLQNALQRVNKLSGQLNQFVYQQARELLQKDHFVGIVGGDHSVPLGALKAVAEVYPSFGILHFDAHSDTRKAYEGFQYSHASIMYNVLEEIPQVAKLVQVGIRDFCEDEFKYLQSQQERVQVFFDRDLARLKYEGTPWKKVCQKIVEALPDLIWVSFDIDGLDPRFCPHTGTPVPGGLDFMEANYLIGEVVRAGKKIIGFDLNEVAPGPDEESGEWDANVGARLLYKLSGWLLASQGRAKLL